MSLLFYLLTIPAIVLLMNGTSQSPLRIECLCAHRYWHRSLNPRKLIEVKFSHLSRNMTMQRTMKLYRLPEASSALGQWAGQKEGSESLTSLGKKQAKGRGGFCLPEK
jgi:hypothetical protein